MNGMKKNDTPKCLPSVDKEDFGRNYLKDEFIWRLTATRNYLRVSRNCEI